MVMSMSSPSRPKSLLYVLLQVPLLLQWCESARACNTSFMTPLAQLPTTPMARRTKITVLSHHHHHHHHHCPTISLQQRNIPLETQRQNERSSLTTNSNARCLSSPLNDEENLILPKNRRSFLACLALSGTFAATTMVSQPANAIPFLDSSSDRRQLELILITVLRTEYWAKNVSKSIRSKLLLPAASASASASASAPNSNKEDSLDDDGLTDYQRKQPYLEARLGAKAILTKKVGGGANSNVYKLASFQLKECLDDGKYWCRQLVKSGEIPSKRTCTLQLEDVATDIVESLASIVEFDGLETTTDPSPRSSLMLGMYTVQKGQFVYRTLTEKVIPACDSYVNIFGKSRRELCEQFIRRDYRDEIAV